MKKAKLLLGITGSIAAYKAAELTRRLQDAGYDVYAALSDGARQFVTDELFQALTRHPIPAAMHSDPLWHTDVGRTADLCVIAPASASFLAKLAAGIADDLLLATLLVSTAPKMLVPAMNEGMWQNPLTQANVKKLRQLGYVFLEPESGWLACGVKGEGRFPDIAHIVAFVGAIHEVPPRNQIWKGKRVVITLGPTREAIDPVRYISNRSSGKMGLALAQACVERGATVILIGNSACVAAIHELQLRMSNIQTLTIESTHDLEKALWEAVRQPVDVLWMAAAVSDFRPRKVSAHKLPRNTTAPALQAIEWETTPDILQAIAQRGPQRPKIVVGFCLVDRQLKIKTQAKRKLKNADVMIGNGPENLGSDSAKVLWCDQRSTQALKGSKAAVAKRLCDLVQAKYFK